MKEGSRKTRLRISVTMMVLAALVLVPGLVFAGGAQEEDGAPKELTVYWNSNHYYDVYKQVFKEFGEEHNLNINVETFLWSDMRTKLLTDFSGNTAPALIEVPAPWIAEFGSKGTMTDLTSRIKEWPESDDWFESTWEEVSVGDAIYGMKLHHTAFALFYNKELFRKAGLDPNSPPKNLTEFKRYTRIINEELGPDVKGFVFDQDAGYLTNFFMSEETPTLLSEDGSEIAIDTPKVEKALTMLQEIAAEEWALVAEPGASYQSSRRAFFEKKTAMMLSGPWDLATLKNDYPEIDYGLAKAPHLKSVENPKILVAGTGIAVPQGTKHTDLVWELMKQLTSVEVEKAATKEAGMLMPRKSWLKNNQTLEEDEKVARFAELLPSARPFDVGASVRGLSSIMWTGGGGDLTTQLYQNLMFNRKPAAEALDEYVKAGNKVLKQNQ